MTACEKGGHWERALEQLRELHDLVAGAANFLPTNIREKFGKQIGELEAGLKSERERLAVLNKDIELIASSGS